MNVPKLYMTRVAPLSKNPCKPFMALLNSAKNIARLSLFASLATVTIAGCDASSGTSTLQQDASSSDRFASSLADSFEYENYGTVNSETSGGVDFNNDAQAVWLNSGAINLFDGESLQFPSTNVGSEEFPIQGLVHALSLNSSGDLSYALNPDTQYFYSNGVREPMRASSDTTVIQNLKLADNGAQSWFQLSRVADIFGNFSLAVDVLYLQPGMRVTTSKVAVLDYFGFAPALYNANDSGSVVWANFTTGTVSIFDGSNLSELVSGITFPAGLPQSDDGNRLLSINNNDQIAWVGIDQSSQTGIYFYNGTSTTRVAELNSSDVAHLNINDSNDIAWVSDNRIYQHRDGSTNLIYTSQGSQSIIQLTQNESGDLAWADTANGTSVYYYDGEATELVRSVSNTLTFVLLNDSGQIAFNDNGTFTVATPTQGGGANPGTGTAGSLIDLIEWNGGYIATFECTIDQNDPDSVLIDFNYTGSGDVKSSWMLTWIGDIETGNVGSGGGYAIRTTGLGYQPTLVQDQSVTFQVLVRNDPYQNADFNVLCSTAKETTPPDGPGNGQGNNEGAPGSLSDLIQWPGGYIATFECNIEDNNPNKVLLDFNYRGTGNTASSWMLTFIGEIEKGSFGTGGSYAIQTTGRGYRPPLSANQLVTFQILIRDASYAGADFDVRCITDQ